MVQLKNTSFSLDDLVMSTISVDITQPPPSETLRVVRFLSWASNCSMDQFKFLEPIHH